ncbi:MAG: histidine phosphatase family protein [Rhodanobacteraceae bacterium]|nr:histidine phosphatase family protein [Rhodanobacteraceae bacterium]MBK7044532.1 histidine phosphatase family protein [Rhodanobacteraceae bacterium]MBP9154296.1 histidine phosphatase family protein [Xanthomonadales bacterium]HQW80939.1 histidine phosphatase family protein [Pseudomonadota bacterium]
MTTLCRRIGWIGLLLSVAQAAAATESPAIHASMQRDIVLVRHGHYAPDPAADPELGPGLSTLGIAQAELLGSQLAIMPRFDAMLVSPMQRAQDTASVLAQSLDQMPRERIAALAECTPPSRDPHATEGVSEVEQQACAQRLDALFAEHFIPAKGAPRRELIVAHGNVIRYLLMRALAADPKTWLLWSVGHTSLSTIRIEADGRMRVLGAGDRGHLPARLQTGAAGDADYELRLPTAK